MNALKNKIKSQRGASITFALLLFLVCAVVSSVVIVAATTASGRMSSLPEIDQRYYAVSSAAELLGKALDGQVVTVVKGQTETIKTTYKADGSKDDDDESDTTEVTLPIKVYSGDLIKDSTLTALESGYASLPVDLAKELTGDPPDPPPSDPRPRSLILSAYGTIVSDGSGITNEEALNILSVDILENLYKNGTLEYYVSKKDDGKEYTLKLTFAADKSENTTEHTQHGSPVQVEGSGYTITDTRTIETTTVFKWILNGITKSTVPSPTT